jgi:uncharacterized protein YmfQ (DUF2313 family)
MPVLFEWDVDLPAPPGGPGAPTEAPATDQAYARQLQQLLPRGAAFDIQNDSTHAAILLAVAAELARVDARAIDLADELDPRTAFETLTDWERILGLPDECTAGTAQTIAERQQAAAQKLIARGGQTAAFYVAIAAALGYPATVSEYRVARSGTLRSGDRLCGEAWAYAWELIVSTSNPAPSIVFRSGISHAGDRLVSRISNALECAINRAKPAHTIVIFTYNP